MVLSVWRAATLARGCSLAFMLAFDLIVDDYDTSGSLSPMSRRPRCVDERRDW